MNITKNWHGMTTPAASARLSLHDETTELDRWPVRIAKIEESLAEARAFRRTARMQLLQPSAPAHLLPDRQEIYAISCDTVDQLEQEYEAALNAIP